MASERRLRSLALVFLRLGSTAFGGPAAHIAMMEDEVVRRRKWLSREEFLDLLGATNLIPGPNSTEMAIHVGLRRAGWRGLLVAGVCFILPAALIVLALAWSYVRWGKLPQGEALLYGVKPVLISVVVQALWRLGRTAARTVPLGLLGAAAAGAVLLGMHELVVLLLAAVTAALLTVSGSGAPKTHRPAAAFPVFPALSAAAAGGAAAFSLGKLFVTFLKIGSVLFGSGYVLLAFLRADFVERLGWLTESQLLDAVAIGQMTPGPIFTTATFIGYLLGGVPAAALATLGIFLPSFLFVALSGPLLPRLRRSRISGAVLDGVNVASLALMAVVTVALGRAAVLDWWTAGLAFLSFVLLLRFRVNSAWLVLGGAAAGLLLRGGLL